MSRGFLVLALALAACGPSAQQRALRATLTTVNATRDAFIVWDRGYQSMIVRNARELEQAKRELAAYRAGREHVVLAFEAVYKALAVAALDPSEVPVTKAVEAAHAALQAAIALGMPAPGR